MEGAIDPISNSEVKSFSADGTALRYGSRSLPGLLKNAYFHYGYRWFFRIKPCRLLFGFKVSGCDNLVGGSLDNTNQKLNFTR